MTGVTCAVLVGSVRKQSLNKRLAQAMTRLAPESMTFRWVRIDDLPFYNGDLEPDRTPQVIAFTDAMKACDAVFCVMPEYNRSIPAILNAVDWGSKPLAENVWLDKPAALAGTSPGAIGTSPGAIGTSPGAIGTAVGQQHLRQVLGATVRGGECSIKWAGDGFIDADDVVSEPSTREFLRAYMARFAALAGRLAG